MNIFIFTELFEYGFWLSHDEVLDRKFDVRVNYAIPAGKPYTGTQSAGLPAIALSGTGSTGKGFSHFATCIYKLHLYLYKSDVNKDAWDC